MADGKVIIDLEINDKDVDKKIDTTDKKINKFAKEVSQKDAKPNIDADTKKLEKSLDKASKNVDKFSAKAEEKANIKGNATLDSSKFKTEASKVINEIKTVQKNSVIEGKVKLDQSDFESKSNKIITEAKTLEKVVQIEGEATLKDKFSNNFEKIKNFVKKPIDIPEPNTDEFEQKLNEMESKVTSFASNIAGALAIGATVKQGVEIGVQSYTDLENALSRVRGALGETEAEAKASGQVIKDVYEAGVGESMDRVADAVIKIKRNLGNLDDGTLNAITQQAIILEDTFEVDMNETLRGAKGLMKNFGLSAQEAMDYIITGTQEGLDWTSELGDNISEYSGKFSQASYSVEEYFQLLKNGADGGAYNLDKVNDAINEVTTRLADGTIKDAISQYSSKTKELFEAWQNGDATQKDVINSIVSDITNCKNQQDALTMSATAFGTMGEDANLTFANALSSVGTTFDDVSGAGQKFVDDTTTPMQELESKIRTLKDQLAPVGEILLNIANVGLDHFHELAGAVLALSVAIIAYKVATKGAAAAQALLNGIMALNPIGIVIAAIAGLVAGFIYLWNTSEDFRKFWTNIWNSVKKITGDVVNSVIDFFTVTIPEAFNSFLEFVGGLVESVKQFFIDLWNGIVEFFTQTIPSWIESVIQFFQKIPYYIGYMIGYVIAQFVQWGADLWNFATVTIPDFIKEVIEWFASLPGKIWEWLVNAYENIVQWGGDIINKGIEVVTDFVNGVVEWFVTLPGRIWDAIVGAVRKIGDWGSDIVKKGLEGAQNLVDTVIEKVEELPGMLADVGKWLVEGLWDGIKGAKDWLFDKVGGFCDGVVDGFKDFFGINSPSRVLRDLVGKFLPQGIAVGFEDEMPKSIKDMEASLKVANLTVSRSINDIGYGVGGAMVMPHFSNGNTTNTTTNNQYIEINQPIETSDEIARRLRLEQRYSMVG